METARVSTAVLERSQAQAVNALTLLAGAPTTGLPEASGLGEQRITADLPAGSRPICWSGGRTSSPPSSS